MAIKTRIHEILEVGAPDDKASRAADVFIQGLILLNVCAFVLESVHDIRELSPSFFTAFETVSVLIFTLEYLLRLWSCTASPAYSGAVLGRLRFAATPLAIIDLLAILPFYLPYLHIDLRIVRMLRVFRIFRLLKMGRYSSAMRTLGRVLAGKKEEFVVILSLLLVSLLFASSAVYYCERDVQPEVFSSVPAALWWGVATLTTVGYGDVYPVTPLGKVMASIMALAGVAIFAIPTGLVGAAFVDELRKREDPRTLRCPHCGEDFQSTD